MKILIFLTVIFCSINVFSYEWYQVESDGIYSKNISTKVSTKNEDFKDLNFESKKLTSSDIKNKFPHFEHPKKIILIGDTGCRIVEKNGKTEYQDCNNPSTWPLQSIMDKVKDEHADLIIHLGDYHYRENCSLGKECQKMTNVYGYGWKPWEVDFFIPMEKVLKEVPIIISRGNHEDCHRAFMGYGKYLSNQIWDKECIEYEEAQIMSFGDIVMINLDNSSIDDRPSTEKEIESLWVNRLNNISEKLGHFKFKQVWLVTHKPAYGLAPFMRAFAPVNINFRNYLEKSSLAKKINVIFSGHIHTSMMVKTDGFPIQIILGNSGTKLENYKSEINSSFLKLFNYNSAEIINNGFGYAIIKSSTDHKWSIEFKDANSNIMKSIDL